MFQEYPYFVVPLELSYQRLSKLQPIFSVSLLLFVRPEAHAVRSNSGADLGGLQSQMMIGGTLPLLVVIARNNRVSSLRIASRPPLPGRHVRQNKQKSDTYSHPPIVTQFCRSELR